MKIDTIRYERKINLGNFEHETIEVTATPAEGQDAVEAMQELKHKVNTFLGQAQVVIPAKEIKKDALDNITHTPEGVVDNNPPAEPIKEEVKEEKKEKKEKKVKAEKKEEKSPVIIYNRELDSHKRAFSDFLTKTYPTWKEDVALKGKAADASRGLVGKDFMDCKTGFLLDSFKAEVQKYFV